MSYLYTPYLWSLIIVIKLINPNKKDNDREQGQITSMPEVAEEMLAASLIFFPIANYCHLKIKNKVKLSHRFTKVSRYFTTLEFLCQCCQLFAEYFLPRVFS